MIRGSASDQASRSRVAEGGGDGWTDAMRSGDWARAWEFSDRAVEARRGVPCWKWPRHLQYIWDGTPLHGRRVLIRCYHGLGDTVQFIRYVPLVKRIAKEVTVWAQPVLIPLLSRVQGIDRLLPLHDGVPECDYDVDVEIMELAHVFRTTVATVPDARVFAGLDWRPAHEPDALHVGLVWQAGGWDERRSLPPSALEPWWNIPGVCWHILQRGSALSTSPSRCVMDGSDAPEVAAEVMRTLDLMISVDSFPAHLAGALGVPTWTLLQRDADWRWMLARDDSPWYPTMRLFRQLRAGEWEEVVERVGTELAGLVRAKTEKEMPAGRTHMHPTGGGN
jgi:hypothetical protein